MGRDMGMDMGNQVEAVLASIIGASGSRELPVTGGEGATTQLHYASLTGTQLFPPAGMSAVDVLICTPSCLQHNLPIVELSRLRAKAIKQQARLADAASLNSPAAPTSAAAIASSSAAAAVTPFTPLSSPSAHHARSFDGLAFVSSARVVVLDEVDALLEGGFGRVVKAFIEKVFLRFEPPPGLEKPSTQARRNRWRRERKQSEGGRNAQQQQEEDAEQELADAEEQQQQQQLESAAAASSSSIPSLTPLRAPQAPAPFGRARQFVFVGATLANISPLACFQYLLNTFTPRLDQPPVSQSGPVSLDPSSIPRSCQLALRLSSGFHHLSPLMSARGIVGWQRVGPTAAQRAPKLAYGTWDPDTGIDEVRLASVDAAGRRLQGADGRDLETGLDQAQQAEHDARQLMAQVEAASLRARGARKVLKKAGKTPAAFASNEAAASALLAGGQGNRKEKATKFEDQEDVEKVAAAVEFINAHTPATLVRRPATSDVAGDVAASATTSPAASSPSPPLKSLLFVSSTDRVDTLLTHLRSLQQQGQGQGQGHGGASLSSRVQLLPYHADLSADERAQTMRLFNSRMPLADGSAAGAGAGAGITHQVLLCTSLAARGLDFGNILAAPFTLGQLQQSGVSAMAQKSGVPAVLPSLAQRAGFESLLQFDLARDVVDYIHRCGRMFRHRPSPHAEESTTATTAVHPSSAAAAADDHHEAAAASTAHPQETPPAKILNLYTAQDELLVSHLRSGETGGAAGPVAAVPSSSAAATPTTIPVPATPALVASFIPDSAFSRKRRLRHKAKKAEKEAAEAANASAHA